MMETKVSVLIPTYKRAHLLSYVLDGLRKQSRKDFDVVIVLKPSGDKTEKIIERYKRWLNLKLVLQKQGYIVDALNLGLEHASGDVVVFLDDDAIPSVDLVERHVESYEKCENCGGVAGNVIPARLRSGELLIDEGKSHIIREFRYPSFLESVFRKVWDVPLEGMEDYLVYVTKAGVVEWNSKLSYIASHMPVKSLLGMGANMSVLRKAVEEFKFPRGWILGLANEQFLGWRLWRDGYNLIFNPEARVYHLVHGESLTRNVKSVRRDVLRWVENYLLFYRLYGLESGLSWMHRVVWFIFSSLVNLKKICRDKEFQQLNQLRGRFYSEIIGLKWLLSKKAGGNYNPLTDLENLLK